MCSALCMMKKKRKEEKDSDTKLSPSGKKSGTAGPGRLPTSQVILPCVAATKVPARMQRYREGRERKRRARSPELRHASAETTGAVVTGRHTIKVVKNIPANSGRSNRPAGWPAASPATGRTCAAVVVSRQSHVVLPALPSSILLRTEYSLKNSTWDIRTINLKTRVDIRCLRIHHILF